MNLLKSFFASFSQKVGIQREVVSLSNLKYLTKFTLLSLLLVAFVTLSSCSDNCSNSCFAPQQIAPGQIQTITKDVENFHNIEISSALHAIITISDVEEVMIEAGENHHPFVVAEVANNTLHLRLQISQGVSIGGKSPLIHIKMKDLKSVTQSGATNVTLNSNGFEFSTLNFKMSGASKFSCSDLTVRNSSIEMLVASRFSCSTLTVPNCSFVARGASSIWLMKGTCENLELNLSGASSFETFDFVAQQDANVKLSEASQFSCSTLTVPNCSFVARGASSIWLKGICENLELNLSDASSFKTFDFVAQYADVKLSGASNAELGVEKELDVNATGASRLNYRGNAVIRNIHLSGHSTCSKK